MFVALVIQHAVHARRIVICVLPGSIIFFHISHTRHDFRKQNIIENKLCVWVFLFKVFETFLIMSRIRIVLNKLNVMERYSCHILMNLKYSQKSVQKVLKTSNLMKNLPLGDDLFHADREMERQADM